ncbi:MULTISPECIES: hypothetical protein [unclassified Arthrobacter]|uniref:hypothetical protein n=1 Tax=unclassified Pseudarthrobacter TaxID=2647000 RepID=UPI0033946809
MTRARRGPTLTGRRSWGCTTRLSRPGEVRVAFEEALILTENDAERRYLRTRLNELAG